VTNGKANTDLSDAFKSAQSNNSDVPGLCLESFPFISTHPVYYLSQVCAAGLRQTSTMRCVGVNVDPVPDLLFRSVMEPL
jgi:hypothetical protein